MKPSVSVEVARHEWEIARHELRQAEALVILTRLNKHLRGETIGEIVEELGGRFIPHPRQPDRLVIVGIDKLNKILDVIVELDCLRAEESS